MELLCDNDPVFRGRPFAVLAARWGVTVRFRATHAPSGNGVVERSHRTVKVIATRKRCSIAEAVHLYDVTPREGEGVDSAPFCGVHRYEPRDCVRLSADLARSAECVETGVAEVPVAEPSVFAVGDAVWVRRRGTRCTEPSRRGTVTAVISPQVVDVDGMPRHVRDLRRRHSESPTRSSAPDADCDDPLYVMEPPVPPAPQPDAGQPDPCDAPLQRDCSTAVIPTVDPRRSQRRRRPPQRDCCVGCEHGT